MVEADLVAGRLACPKCGRALRRWGFAKRRELRWRTGGQWLRPRRSICPGCAKTHVLLGEDSLVRRRDAAEVIGTALVAKAAGSGHRRIAATLALPATTVRGWLRRFDSAAERIRAHFTRWAHALDPLLPAICPTDSAFADAVEAVGIAARSAVRRLGSRPAWSLASVLTGGELLANTSSPWAAPG